MFNVANLQSWYEVLLNLLKVMDITVEIYIITIVCSIPLGIILALAKISGVKVLNVLVGIFTWIVRGTPLLLQLMFVYYGLGLAFGLTLTKFEAASITFIVNYAAYFTEIFRGGIQSIDKGQYEAAKALGMNYKQTMSRIILPQTVRRILPPISNEAITLVKDTALVSTLAMNDILRTAKQISSRTVTLSPYIIAGILYLLLTSVVVLAFRKLEKKYALKG